MPVQPAVLFVIGAPGAGKTTAVRALEARSIDGLRCYYFDSIGVPSSEVMISDFGGTEAWQAATTHFWVDRITANPDSAKLVVLDSQTRPSYLRTALTVSGLVHYQIVLLDCAPDVRFSRLAGRRQPELATPEQELWAAYLRGQADALGLPVLYTSEFSVEVVADRLEAELAVLCKSHEAAEGRS